MLTNLFDLKDKVAVVTGGTGVLGSAMANGLAEAGAWVVILGRRKEVGEAIANELRVKGYNAIALEVDVLKEDQLHAAEEKILQWAQRIDILVNAVGGNLAGATIPPDKNFFDLNIQDFEKVIDLNLLGTVLPTKIFARSMAQQKQGVIINISSMASFRPVSRVGGYAAAKSAVSNFTQWLAVEMCQKFGEGIRVNAIAPGFFITEQNRSLLTNPDGSLTERSKRVLQNTPFGRFGKPEELVGTLVWLCSEASAFVTGTVIPVDGGFNAYCGV